MKMITLDMIKECFVLDEAVAAIEQSFVDYSSGRILSAPVSRFHFKEANADLHIKSGMVKLDDSFVIKIAAGFYDNVKLGLPSSRGIMILLNAHNGAVEAIIQDEGYLTDLRTAIAGVICAKYLAPKGAKILGVMGSVERFKSTID